MSESTATTIDAPRMLATATRATLLRLNALLDDVEPEWRATRSSSLASVPFFSALQESDASELRKPTPQSIEHRRQALVEGDWRNYHSELALQGRTNANSGVPLGAWYELARLYRAILRARIAKGQDPAELRVELENVSDCFLDASVLWLTEGYLATKEGLAAREEERRREAEIGRDAYRELFRQASLGLLLFEVPADRKPGTFRLLAANAASTRLRGTEFTAAIGKELSQLEDRMRHAQRIEGIGRLAGGVAHDFNNILTVILGCTQFAMEGIGDLHPVYVDLADVVTAARRAEKLTRQLLAFSRQQPISPVRLNVDEVIEGVLPMIERLIGETITVETDLQSSDWDVRMDRGALEQVLVNLCVNARDAMNGTGTLRIRTTYTDTDLGPVDHDQEEQDSPDRVVLEVSDTGAGMSEATKQHIFEPFFTTKELGQGTGLGLATCHGIVKQAGGTIRVESTFGRGTTFRILLPRDVRPEEELTPAPTRPVTVSGSERILLVDDDLPLQHVMVRVLMELGYGVELAGSCQAARASVLRSGSPDLLITDLGLPDGDGVALADLLVREHEVRKVLFISAYLLRHLPAGMAIPVGAMLLEKPFAPDQFAVAIRQCLDGPSLEAQSLTVLLRERGGPPKRP